MAIQIENSFNLNLPPQQVWDLLNDIERIAPCVPGARLNEMEADEFRGLIKIKLGPITAEYRGSGRITDTDPIRRMVIEGRGRDAYGQGNASAKMTAIFTPEADGTRVNVTTDLSVAGKVAQLGRGVMQDVSGHLVDQFVGNLREMVARESGTVSSDGGDQCGQAPAAADAGDGDDDAIDLLAVGTKVFGRRMLVAGAVILIVVLGIVWLAG